MLIHPTVERLRALGLSAMADAFIEMQNAPEAAELTREDWLGLLVDREATSRENKRLARRLREAKLRQAAVVEDVNLHAPRGLDRALFQKLATCEWVRDHHHLVVVGPTGIGKSWLAQALAQKACRDGYAVWYRPVPKLFRDLMIARADGSLSRVLENIARTDVLVVDDFAMAPMNEQERRDFLEICDDRYNRRSTILTSQLPVANWHPQIGDPTIADSILDRLVHNAYRIDMLG